MTPHCIDAPDIYIYVDSSRGRTLIISRQPVVNYCPTTTELFGVVDSISDLKLLTMDFQEEAHCNFIQSCFQKKKKN